MLHDASRGGPVTGVQIVGTAHARYIGDILIGNAYCLDKSRKTARGLGEGARVPSSLPPSLCSRCSLLFESLEQA